MINLHNCISRSDIWHYYCSKLLLYICYILLYKYIVCYPNINGFLLKLIIFIYPVTDGIDPNGKQHNKKNIFFSAPFGRHVSKARPLISVDKSSAKVVSLCVCVCGYDKKWKEQDSLQQLVKMNRVRGSALVSASIELTIEIIKVVSEYDSQIDKH